MTSNSRGDWQMCTLSGCVVFAWQAFCYMGCIPIPRIVLAALGPPRQDRGWNEAFYHFVLTLILHCEKHLCYLFVVFGLSVLKLLYPRFQH